MRMKTSLVLMFLFLAAGVVRAQVASGGDYTLHQGAVVSGGGASADSTGSVYKVEGSGGQTAAGANSTGSPYGLRGGFWSGAPAAPTAADVVVSGRVVGMKGGGIKNARVTLTGGTLVSPLTVRTDPQGRFTFENVEVGQMYVITVSSKAYGFAENSRVLSLMDNATDLVFQAAWAN